MYFQPAKVNFLSDFLQNKHYKQLKSVKKQAFRRQAVKSRKLKVIKFVNPNDFVVLNIFADFAFCLEP
jgi:hypothetical protein